MQRNRNAIQLLGLLMSKQSFDINNVLDLIEILNDSPMSCRQVITILEYIFKYSSQFRFLSCYNQALEYLVKNCRVEFHLAANRESFQKRILSLLNRIRGKTSIIKQLNSNTDNWCKIEAKVLYIIQLWYDAFILEENNYPHIINNYKILRKENITFPPRSKNQRSLMLVSTNSPIFENIEQIAQQDQKKFNKKLVALGMGHLTDKMSKSIEIVQSMNKNQLKAPNLNKFVDIDQISEKIAIIQSTKNCTLDTLKIIEEIKNVISKGVVKPNQQNYWKQIKTATNQLIEQWQNNNAQLIKQEELRFLQKRLGLIGNSINRQIAEKTTQNNQKYLTEVEQKKFESLEAFNAIKINEKQKPSLNGSTLQKKQQINLLDL